MSPSVILHLQPCKGLFSTTAKLQANSNQPCICLLPFSCTLLSLSIQPKSKPCLVYIYTHTQIQTHPFAIFISLSFSLKWPSWTKNLCRKGEKQKGKMARIDICLELSSNHSPLSPKQKNHNFPYLPFCESYLHHSFHSILFNLQSSMGLFGFHQTHRAKQDTQQNSSPIKSLITPFFFLIVFFLATPFSFSFSLSYAISNLYLLI